MPDRPTKIMASIPERYAPDFVEQLDGRTLIARAIRGRIEAIETDMGGADTLSHARRSLVRRVVWLEAIVEHSEQKLAAGDGIDLAGHTQAINSLARLYRLIGLERRAKPAMGLHEFMAATAAAAAPSGDPPEAEATRAPEENAALTTSGCGECPDVAALSPGAAEQS